MALDYHLKNIPWEDIMKKAIQLGYRSHQTSTCGLHVHVNRNALGNEVISKMLYIICQKDGSPYKSDSFSMKFRRFLKAKDLKHICFHDFRHINATIMLPLGISPKLAQQRLGHSSYQITMDIYSHVLKKVEKEAADKLDALFEKPSA